jgi:hypothetical protein
VVEEAITDWLVGIWRWGLADFIPAVIRFFIDLFKGLLEWVEQGLYVVDEWLRFRSGESRTVLFAKAALSVPWFCVTYVFRFAIFVLIEPQINPVKHFPVVTVAHKVMLAIVPLLTPPVAGWLEISNARAGGLIIGVIWLIPGVFGFAVWELKENWKLYAANRSRNLKPVIIGSHGETMLRLLKPGFHSGTIPKLFRKLRRGERRGQRRTVRKTVAALHHVEESVVHFVERELSALLKKSKVWNDLHVELAAVHLATNRVAVHLKCEELGNKALKLSFDQQSGWLWAGVLDPGWLINLAGQKRETFAVALAGLYKMAGVQITREQVTKALAPMQAVFAIRDKGLVIWEAPELFHEAIVDLTARPVIEAHAGSGALPACLMRPLKPTTLLFSETPLSWNEWVRIWEEETSNLDGAPHRFDTAVLP